MKSIFDLATALKKSHVNWEDIPDKVKQDSSTFLLNRILSMDFELVQLVNLFQLTMGYNADLKVAVEFYSEEIPKSKYPKYSKWVKQSKGSIPDDELIALKTIYPFLCTREIKSSWKMFPKEYIKRLKDGTTRPTTKAKKSR